jgi:hypothetical protein
VHRSSGLLADHHTNVVIEPDDVSAPLLVNRNGGTNADGRIECEVNVGSDWRDRYEEWMKTLLSGAVTAQGVWVDDNDHDSNTELHPLDVNLGTVDSSFLCRGLDREPGQPAWAECGQHPPRIPLRHCQRRPFGRDLGWAAGSPRFADEGRGSRGK